MAGFMDNYESVEDRIPKFWADHPQGRMVTDLIAHADDEWVFRCELYREGDTSPWSTGHAHEEKTDKGVNATSACENCETSAIGRALANAGYAAKGKRASREEMSKTGAASAAPTCAACGESLAGADVVRFEGERFHKACHEGRPM